ncbi:MAG: site-2 protease family protein [Oscillospiraceae bacterium]
MGILSVIRSGDVQTIIMTLISTTMVLLICLPIHEWAHGFVAYKLGDRTAKNLGRLDINPFAHLDIAGTIAIFLFGFGWAKPVPVNMRNFKNPNRDMAIVALAGPASNFLLGTVILMIAKIIILFSPTSQFVIMLFQVLKRMIFLNISLSIFNLIPIPPLDGSKILGAILPERIYYKILEYERYGIFVVYAVMFTGILDKPLYMAQTAMFNCMDFLTGFVDFIGKAIA